MTFVYRDLFELLRESRDGDGVLLVDHSRRRLRVWVSAVIFT